MGRYSQLDVLICQWTKYLKQRGHHVNRSDGLANVLLSRNGQAIRYRWLLLHARSKTRRFTAIEHENIQRQVRLGHKSRAQVYVVVKFDRPTGKILILPAGKAAKMGQFSADRGGIPWES